MKSPFPGMDPYFEVCGLWEGFHNRLVEAIYRAIAGVLPRGYTADTAVRRYTVMVGFRGQAERLVRPDVTITERVAEATGSVLMRAFIAERFEETFVEIYHEGEERVLVTCIEVLSPSNKRPNTEGWKEYQRKRQAMLLGRANFIEIDLLRGGHKMPMLDPWPESPYTLLVCRADNAPYCRAWPAHFRSRLPAIPVPLLEPDPDLTLDLQPLLDGIYALGRYGERLDYTRPLTPPLSGADAAWVRSALKKSPSQ
jgi:hypothetical protein